jgi:hypothetical protein
MPCGGCGHKYPGGITNNARGTSRMVPRGQFRPVGHFSMHRPRPSVAPPPVVPEVPIVTEVPIVDEHIETETGVPGEVLIIEK